MNRCTIPVFLGLSLTACAGKLPPAPASQATVELGTGPDGGSDSPDAVDRGSPRAVRPLSVWDRRVVEQLGKDGELLLAAKQGDLAGVQRLIEEGANREAVHLHDLFDRSPFESGFTPLAYAAHGGHVEMVDYLLSKGAERGDVVMLAAATGGQLEMVRSLLDKGIGTDCRAKTEAMVHATDRGQLRVVELLLANGAQVDGTARGWEVRMTALGIAAVNQDIKAVRLLMSKNANVNGRDGSRATPLMHAARLGAVLIAKQLVNSGADLDAKDYSGSTALHHSAKAETAETAELLVKRGAKVDLRDDFGETPLFKAVFQGRSELVRLLVKAGANVSIANQRGETPLDHARKHKQDQIARVLESKGAKPGKP